MTVGFTESSYSSSEAEAVEVCVAVLSGELGTDITLHLDSLSGSALGKTRGLCGTCVVYLASTLHVYTSHRGSRLQRCVY